MRALLLTLAACGSAAAPVASPAQLPVEELRRLAVTDDDFYRPVLYTWTTPEAIASLRASRELLVATASSGAFISPFNRALARVAEGGGPGAVLARTVGEHPALIRRRYAWPAPFATVRGLGPLTYGSALVRIELHPDAWIGRFAPGTSKPWKFVDAKGEVVPEEVVLLAPQRIGAIYHVRTETAQSAPFREYVVCGAAMLSRWAVATPDIRAELDREIRLLTQLRTAFTGEPPRPAWRAWALKPRSDLRDLWSAALAFDNARYHPTQHRIDQILDALSTYDPAGEPFEL
jgi:hypothetical protein